MTIGAVSDPPGTGPRRRRLSEAERRDQILRATVEVVARYGYDGASLARVAEQAGVSKGLVSHYFGSKDDLMAEAVTGTVRALRESIAAQLDLSAPVPEVIRAALRRAADLHRSHRAELTALEQIVHGLRLPDGSPRLGPADYEETHDTQRRLFARGQEEGSLRPLDVHVLAVVYQGAVDTMLGHAAAHPDADLDRFADTLADVLLGGIATDPTRGAEFE